MDAIILFVTMNLHPFLFPEIILFAIGWDFFLKEPPNRLHPVTLLGKYIALWSRVKFDIKNPLYQKIILFSFGTLMMILGIGICMAAMILMIKIISPFPVLFIVISAFFLKTSFSAYRLWHVSKEIYHALMNRNLMLAQDLTSYHLVSRDTKALNESYISSAVIESLAENLVDSIISPLTYYLIGGLPLAWAYRFVNTADAMIGYHTPQYEYLGKFAARLDDALNFIPARMSGLIILLSAMICRMNFRNAFKVMVSESTKTESPNAGIPMSAVAGALEINLEKINHYQIYGGSNLPRPTDILSAIHLLKVAVGIWYIICIIISSIIYWSINI